MENPVATNSPTQEIPPHLPQTIGGPSQTFESTNTTMVDDLVRFQSNKARPAQASAEAVVAPEAPAAAVVPTTQGDKGIFYNGKMYSPEEMTSVLRERDDLRAKVAEKPAPVAAPAPVTEEDDLETLMYSDPKRYNQLIEDRAVKKTIAHLEQQKQQEKIATDFYSQYKDLKGNEDLVEYYAVKMKQGLANDAPEVALSKLAQAVRTRISALSGQKVATEELSSKPAVTVGATGTSSGSSPAAAKGPESMSFIEQLQRVQRRGKTRY